MIKIESIAVIPTKVDKLLVQWKYAPTLENFANYKFTLERSFSSESEFEPVVSFSDLVQYLDEVNYKRLWKTVYYRIKVCNIPTGQVAYSDAGKIGYQPNLEALEIVRRNDILLKNKRHGIGVPVVVFARKRAGQRCPDCWDEGKKRVRVSNCDSCYQTGFLGGFYEPMIAWANTTPDSKQNPLPQWGETEPNDTKLFFSNYPELSAKDIILEPTLMRAWSVEAVDTTARRGCVLHQVATLAYLDRNNVAYKLIERNPDLIDRIRGEKDKIQRA